MNSKGKVVGAGKGYRARNPQVAPVTKAVRSALAVSALALAAVSGTAFACDPPVVVGSTTSIECNDPAYATSIIGNAVDDLTVVINNLGGGVAITPGIGQVGIGLSATGSANLGIYGGTTITTDGATGVSVFAYGQADVTNAGAIYVTNGNGIEVLGLDGASVINDGLVDVNGSGYLQGISVVSPYGLAEVINNGDVTVYSSDIAIGIYAGGAGGATVTNNGLVDAYGIYGAAGVVAYGYNSGVTVDNSGQLYGSSKYGPAFGVVAYGNDASVTNGATGYIGAFSFYGDAVGVQAYAGVGQANVTNEGDIDARAFYGSAVGIYAAGFDGANVTNNGEVFALGYYNATGIVAYSAGTASVGNNSTVRAISYGSATGIESRGYSAYAFNNGDVFAYSYYGDATGISAVGQGGVAGVVNDGLVVAESEYGVATGITAGGAYGAAVYNTGGVYAFGYLGAYGIVADGGDGNAQVDNLGGLVVAVTENGYAAGIFSYGDTATVNNTGDVYGISNYGGSVGISAEGLNGATVDSAGDIRAIAYLDATAVRAYTDYGVADITNGGRAYASSDTGNAFGLYAYSTFGDASVVNTGTAAGIAYNGVGDGIFASGYNVTVDNQGVAVGVGYNFGAGIEAQGAYSVVVDNGAGATAYGYGGYYGFGIYATGGAGGATITNAGQAIGLAQLYGFGIYAESGGNTSVFNDASGVVVGGDINNTALGTGIHAGTSAIDGLASVDNAGTVNAAGYYGATGIEAIALSPGGMASVSNSGLVTASQYSKYGVGAAGILALGDGSADIENLYGGSIEVTSGGVAYGALAISLAGDATVTNAGDISAISTDSALYYGSYGIVAVAGYGNASVVNTGNVYAASQYAGGYRAIGILADGNLAASVANSGDVIAQGKYANGIIAQSGQGNATVDNSGLVGAYGKYAYGAQAISTLGDALVTNSGSIYAVGDDLAVGALAFSVEGNAAVDNTGLIQVDGYSLGYGVFVRADYGSAAATNAGDIFAQSYYGNAVAIGARGLDASIDNSGNAYAIGYYGAVGAAAIGYDGASVTNTGTIVAAAYLGDTTGIRAISPYGDVVVDNAGDVSSASINYDAIGVLAYSLSGNASVNNDGAIYASGKYGQAVGIVAQGYTANVTGGGNVYAVADTQGIGIQAQAVYGATVDVGGDIEVIANYNAIGIMAESLAGDASVTSGGLIDVEGAYAFGIMVEAYGDATAVNNGSIDAYSGVDSAFGIYAFAEQGNASVDNAGDILADGQYTAAGVFSISVYGDSLVNSDGLVDVSSAAGTALGLFSRSIYGSSIVTNGGDILAVADAGGAYGVLSQGPYAEAGNTGNVLAIGYDRATGIAVYGAYAASIDNGGTAIAESYAGRATGLYAASYYGDALVANSGSGFAYSYLGGARAAYAISSNGDATVDSSGTLEAESLGAEAIGAFARAYYGTATVTNAGDITATGADGSIGALAVGLQANIGNTGSVQTIGTTDSAFGLYALALYDASVVNGGNVYATSTNNVAVALAALADNGDAVVSNTGTLSAYSFDGIAAGAYVVGYNSVAIDNAGDISAVAGDATGTVYGVVAQSFGDVTITNSGTISATHDTLAIVVRMASYAGASRLYNSGLVDAGNLGGGSIAVLGSNAVDEVHNTGRINGHIVTGGGDDIIDNGAGGEWYLGGSSTNLGAGADQLNNAGLIVFGNGTMYLGDGDDVIVNSGDLVLGNAGIDLGLADTTNSFDNTGTIHVIDSAFINMGAGGTLYSDGTISFLDGATDDMMTVYGNFAGAGDVNVDIDFIAGTSDMLYIEGDITGDVKTINVAAVNLPATLDFDPIDVVIASGAADPASFVAGQLFGFESELLDFGLSVEHSVVGTDNVFSIGIGIDGLSDAGNLAVTLAPGVHSMIGTNIGTLRQRLGVLPDLGGDLNGLGPWVRRFTSSGDIDATGTGFAAGEDLRFSNDVDGTEVGMNFTLGHGFHYGVLLGKTDNNRALMGGVGRDDIQLDSAGLYATWLAENFYVDASWRWMDFDSRMRSSTDEYRASGNARAINLEAGYTGWELGGFSLVPQVQYTRASIDNIDSISGTLTEVALDGGDSERLRLGLGFERSFATAGGYRITPYGSINAVNEMDGTSRFIVNGNAALSGEVEADGTFGMVELGVGVQKNGWSASAGMNWADGGSVDSDFGGQVVVRYTW